MPGGLLRLTVTCATCQKVFRPDKRERMFCSRACYREATKPDRQVRQCEQCGQSFQANQNRTRFCNKACSTKWIASRRPNTRGWYQTTQGYILIYVPEHPNASKTGYVMQHRLVMEEKLGRPILSQEVVHHKNGVKDDNRLENLEVMLKRHHDGMRRPRYIATCPHCRQEFPTRGNVRTAPAK